MLNFKRDSLEWHKLYNRFCDEYPVAENNWFFFYLMDNDIKDIDEAVLASAYEKFQQIGWDTNSNPPDSWRGL